MPPGGHRSTLYPLRGEDVIPGSEAARIGSQPGLQSKEDARMESRVNETVLDHSKSEKEWPLIMFPPTTSGYEARMRLETMLLSIHQTQCAAESLMLSFVELLNNLPGHGPLKDSFQEHI